VRDTQGNLYGTTELGGAFDKGVVFEFTPGAGPGTGLAILYTFNGTNGTSPEAGLILDFAGNLFGTASSGGSSGAGVVFELSPVPVPEPNTYAIVIELLLIVSFQEFFRRSPLELR